MEERVVNILLDIKADIGELKKGQFELKTDVSILKTEISTLKTDVVELKTDMAEVKTTVNALADALLETSQEVKQLKTKKG